MSLFDIIISILDKITVPLEVSRFNSLASHLMFDTLFPYYLNMIINPFTLCIIGILLTLIGNNDEEKKKNY